MSSKESMDLSGSSRRRGSAPKAGSVWESRMKLDEVKGGIKVFKATDENSAQNIAATEIEIHQNANPKQSPNGVMSGKRKTWKSESCDASPVKIANLRSELGRNLDEQSDGIRKSPVSIKKSSLRKAKSDSAGGGIKDCDGGDERERKSRSDEDCEEIKAVDGINGGDERERKSRSDEDCEEIKVVDGINGGDEGIEVEKKSVDVEEIAVDDDDKHERIVIEERKMVQSNQRAARISSFVRKQPPPSKINTNSDNFHRIPRTNSRLQSFVDLVMWRDVAKSAFVFGIGTFAIISSSYTKELNISFISVLSYLGLVYLAAIFLFRSFISRGSVKDNTANQARVIGEEEAIWVMKLLLPFINEFLLKLRALFSGDPSTTMKLAVLLFILARCGSSITIWTMAKLGFVGVFTVPKVCSAYYSQITAYVTFWIIRFRDAWASCSHKKAVGFAVFALVWNLSSVVARIWAVFMLFVAFKHYQQSLIKEGWAEDEAINGQDSSCQGPTPSLGRRTTLHNTGNLKKAC